MKAAIRIALWMAGTFLLFVLVTGWAEISNRKNCEERLAKELNTTAVYIHGRCMVKGYIRADGR